MADVASLRSKLRLLEREIFVKHRNQERLRRDFEKDNEELQDAQSKQNSELVDNLTHVVQSTSDELSRIDEQLSVLETELEQLRGQIGIQNLSKSLNLGETRWRLTGKQMFDVCKDSHMQRFFSVTLQKLHSGILNTIKEFHLRTVEFKLESGNFKGQCFTSIFRYSSSASQFLICYLVLKSYCPQGQHSLSKHQNLVGA